MWIECDNCHEKVDDYYYKSSSFTFKTCSISCMAEALCKIKVNHLKVHLDCIQKVILKERAL